MRARDVAGTAAIAFVSVPVLVGGGYAFAAAAGLVGAGATGFDTGRLARVLGSGETWRSVAWTVATAGLATVLAAAAAVTVAIRLRLSRWGRWLALFPLSVPHVAAALAVLLLLGQSGLLSRVAYAAGWIAAPAEFPVLAYDQPHVSLILAFAWKEFPFLALTALAVIDTLGDSLADAARTLGATAGQVSRRVTWPLLWRGLAPAAIAVFAYLLGQYEMAVLVAPSDPPSLAVLTYERAFDPDLAHRGDAYVLALMGLAFTGMLVVLHARLRRAAEESRT